MSPYEPPSYRPKEDDMFTAAYGTLILGTTDNSDDLWLVSAPDPVILVASEILWQIRWDKGRHPAVTLTRPETGHGSTGHGCGDHGCYAPPGDLCHYGSVLRIRTVQQTLVYVIDEYDLERHAWSAHWPD